MLRLPKFRYLQPGSIAEAIQIMADSGPGAMFVAGGTDLYPNMKRRQQTPKVVIALAQIDDLCTMKGEPKEGVVLGAGMTLADVTADSRIQRAYPAVAKAAELISTPLLRNMGSIGGNLLLDTRCNYYDQNYEWRKAIHFCMKKDGEICWVAPSSPRCWAVQSSDCRFRHPSSCKSGSPFATRSSGRSNCIAYRAEGFLQCCPCCAAMG